jgi:uncharacterized protein YjbI with pentapeptide repeats
LRGRDLDLADAELPTVDLSSRLLVAINFRNANLERAFLPQTEFFRCNLKGCHLRYAHLSGAFFFEVDLRGADLCQASAPGDGAATDSFVNAAAG